MFLYSHRVCVYLAGWLLTGSVSISREAQAKMEMLVPLVLQGLL